MNSKTIKGSLLLISTCAFLVAGCGPLNANDTQTEENIMNKDGDAPAPRDARGLAQGPRGQAQAPGNVRGPQGPQGQQGGCPAGGCRAAGGQQQGGCPTGDCEIPPEADTYDRVQLPDQFSAEPTIVVPTSEEHVATDVVDYHTTRHITQPTVRQHVVNQHRHAVRRDHLEIVYHPTYRRVNSLTRSSSCSQETMPTVERTEPPVDYGCSFAVPAQPVVVPVAVPVRPFFRF